MDLLPYSAEKNKNIYDIDSDDLTTQQIGVKSEYEKDANASLVGGYDKLCQGLDHSLFYFFVYRGANLRSYLS
jgi:hypothetical protein